MLFFTAINVIDEKYKYKYAHVSFDCNGDLLSLIHFLAKLIRFRNNNPRGKEKLYDRQYYFWIFWCVIERRMIRHDYFVTSNFYVPKHLHKCFDIKQFDSALGPPFEIRNLESSTTSRSTNGFKRRRKHTID